MNISNDIDLSVFWTSKQIEALKSASFPSLDMSNFLIAMKIAKQYELDPFAKEIWWWEQSGKTMIVVAYAWYLRIARQQTWFIQIETQPVFSKDEFEIDYVEKTIKHKLNVKDMAKVDTPIGAWARLTYMSNGVKCQNVKYVRWDEYARGNVWNTNKSAMITKVAGTVVIREVYGLSWLYTEEEMGKIAPDENQEPFKIVAPDLSKLIPTAEKIETTETAEEAIILPKQEVLPINQQQE